jgi:hypothetical protein
MPAFAGMANNDTFFLKREESPSLKKRGLGEI